MKLLEASIESRAFFADTLGAQSSVVYLFSVLNTLFCFSWVGKCHTGVGKCHTGLGAREGEETGKAD